MVKQYTCVDCKRSFQSQFALTAHIRFCKKKTAAKCPECGKVCNRKGLASHRASVHGVAGTSRWSIRARKAAKKPAKRAAKKSVVSSGQMESVVRRSLQKPFFQEILQEWAAHIENAVHDKAVDATTFANLYLEMLRDPNEDEARQGCSAFATFMKPRNWKKILEVLRGVINKETLATFKKPEAEIFYNKFKQQIIEQITAYWESFLEGKIKKQPTQEAETWKDQAIKDLAERIAAKNAEIEAKNAEIKKLEQMIQDIRDLK